MDDDNIKPKPAKKGYFKSLLNCFSKRGFIDAQNYIFGGDDAFLCKNIYKNFSKGEQIWSMLVTVDNKYLFVQSANNITHWDIENGKSLNVIKENNNQKWDIIGFEQSIDRNYVMWMRKNIINVYNIKERTNYRKIEILDFESSAQCFPAMYPNKDFTKYVKIFLPKLTSNFYDEIKDKNYKKVNIQEYNFNLEKSEANNITGYC